MNRTAPILLAICLLASAVATYGAEMVSMWNVEGQADGIAVGPEGEVYVNINQNHKVVKYSPEGEVLTEWPLEGDANGIATGPGGEV